jgi:hypothetical protein
MQMFYKGRTNNHLTWVMVDATDFATPESALSAATKIKIYGKLRSATGVNFVSSGTGSLTNDIQHVGASATGIYTIALAKADLSDASAAWYDQYVINLSATGAAYQTLIVDGGIDNSEVLSQLLLTLSAASDAASAAAQGNSRVLLVQSRLSDLNSVFTSDISDLKSMLTALSDAISDMHSDVRSLVTTTGVALDASTMSDLRSAIAGVTATLSVSDISDIASAVWAHTIGARVDSRVLLNLSRISDTYSLVTAGVPLDASTMSDLRSAINAGPAATVTASDISDIASAVWAHTIGARVDSRVLLNQSRISDTYSLITAGVPLDASTMSDLRSAINAGPAATVTASDISDIASAVRAILVSDLSDLLSRTTQINSRVLVTQSQASDIYSMLSDGLSGPMTASDLSDIASAVWAHATGAAVNSRVLLNLSRISDVQSLVTAGVPLDASTMSDLRSAIAGVTAAVSASDMSDIASRVGVVLASDLSDLLSRTTQINSRVALVQSNVSDVESQVDAGVPLDASTMSDLRSAIAAATIGASSISDIASAVWATARVEPTAVVSPTGDMKTGIEWLVAMHRNKITQTSAVQSLRNDADAADIASAAVSDDGTTFTRGEWG